MNDLGVFMAVALSLLAIINAVTIVKIVVGFCVLSGMTSLGCAVIYLLYEGIRGRVRLYRGIL